MYISDQMVKPKNATHCVPGIVVNSTCFIVTTEDCNRYTRHLQYQTVGKPAGVTAAAHMGERTQREKKTCRKERLLRQMTSQYSNL